ncbi:MAG: hypothetical protein KF777_08345 [Planctomycetaceae bacterium]|nr:hypothetical protein [Planctomycetaceae bacterium]
MAIEHARIVSEVPATLKASLPPGTFQQRFAQRSEFFDRTARSYLMIAVGRSQLNSGIAAVFFVRGSLGLLRERRIGWLPEPGEITLGNEDASEVVLVVAIGELWLRIATALLDGELICDSRGLRRSAATKDHLRTCLRVDADQSCWKRSPVDRSQKLLPAWLPEWRYGGAK